jgi:hypothetical protein
VSCAKQTVCDRTLGQTWGCFVDDRRDGVFSCGGGVLAIGRAFVVPSMLAIAPMLCGAASRAQELEGPGGLLRAPSVPSPPVERHSLFTAASYAEFIVPPAPLGVRVYGFYVAEVKTPIVLFETPVQVGKFLTITPGVQYLDIPKSQLGKLTVVPIEFGQSYVENQARLDATVKFTVGHLEIGERNMYVRRFRPGWVGPDVDRYRNRLMLTQTVTVKRRAWKPFASYEAFHDGDHLGWVRYRLWSGVTVPVEKRVSLQPSYVRDDNRTRGVRDINYLMFALIATAK